MKRLPRLTLAAAALALFSTSFAQNYPTRPVRMMVPFPAGGGSDTMGRIVGAKLSERAHFTEHLRMLDADILEDRMTIEDPLRFTRPWEVSLRYRRVKNLDRLIATGCEHDRNPVVNGRLVIAPP